jgi:hypothetical protein
MKNNFDDNFRPLPREKDGGPIINWLAERALRLSSWLMEIALPYAVLYEWSATDETTD